MRLRSLIILVLFACVACAAAIDGKWTAEFKMKGGKKNPGQERTVQVTLNLKSNGNQLSGTAVTSGGRRDRTAQIQNGKIEGNRFSFTTVQSTKKGEQKQEWRGTIEGDTLQGTRGREGARRGQPFTAKRAS